MTRVQSQIGKARTIIKLGEKMYENINFGLKRKKEKIKNLTNE